MNNPGMLGAMGFLGGLLNQSPLTQPFMNAGRTGLAMARHGQTPGAEDDLDFGEAFLNVPNSFGWQAGQAPLTQQEAVSGPAMQMPASIAPSSPGMMQQSIGNGLLDDEEMDVLMTDPYGLLA